VIAGDRSATGGGKAVETPLVRIAPAAGSLNLNLLEIWQYRELLYFLIWRNIKVRYKQTIIGAGWAIIQPFLTMVIFSLFFGMLARLPSEGLPYPIFYYSALLPWVYFANALNQATHTIVEHQHVIAKTYFPRVLLPISAVLSGLVDFALAFVVFVGMMVWYRIMPSARALALPLFLLLAISAALAIGLWLSALNAMYRDVRYALPYAVQLWMFASPVAYPSSLVPEGWRWIYALNPMATVIEGFRWALLGQGWPLGNSILGPAAVVFLLMVGGFAYFQRVEGTIADIV